MPLSGPIGVSGHRDTRQYTPSGSRFGESRLARDAFQPQYRFCSFSKVARGAGRRPSARKSRSAKVIELAKVVGHMGGIHISRVREEASHVPDSVRETIRIGEEEGHLPTQI